MNAIHEYIQQQDDHDAFKDLSKRTFITSLPHLLLLLLLFFSTENIFSQSRLTVISAFLLILTVLGRAVWVLRSQVIDNLGYKNKIIQLGSIAIMLAWACILSSLTNSASSHPPQDFFSALAIAYFVGAALMVGLFITLESSRKIHNINQAILVFGSNFGLLLVKPFPMAFLGAAIVSTLLGLALIAIQTLRTQKNKEKSIERNTLKILFDNYPGAISIIENDIYTHVNHTLEKMTGLRANDLIGRHIGFYNPESHFHKCYKAFKKSTLPKGQYEILLETAHGPRHHLLHFHRASQNDSSVIFAVTIDIEEKMRVEKELEKQRALISHSAKLAALGEMSGNLAHEINNPLAIIGLNHQVIRDEIEKENINKNIIRNSLNSIEKTIQRISKTIKSLRSLAREGEQDAFDSVKLSEIIEDTLIFCEARFRKANIEIKISIPPETTIYCRSVQISQVILNALTNAFDAIQNLDITQPKWIEIKSETTPLGQVKLQIIDSGPGIPQELRDKVMTPFFTTKPVGKGTGIGLSLSKRLMEENNGKFQFNFDHPNTCVEIYIPKA